MTYNARRKADREAVAKRFLEIAEKYEATVDRRDEPKHPGWRGPAISLDFTSHGVGVIVTISDLHGGLEGVLHWYNAGPTYGRKYTSAFRVAVGGGTGGTNPSKATSMGTWDTLAGYLERGLRRALIGEAFEEQLVA
jgi:hypothetical protein